MIRDTVVTLATRIALFALSSVAAIITSRLLGPDGRGIYYLVITYLGLLALIGSVGLEAANTYFGAKNCGYRRHLFWNSLIGGITSGTALVFIGWLAIMVCPQSFRGLSPTVVLVGLLGLPWIMVGRFLMGLILGLQDIVAYNTLNVLERGLFLALLISLLPLWGRVEVAIGAYAIVQVAIATLAVGYCARRGLVGPRPQPNFPVLRKSVHFGFKSQVGNIFQYMNYRLAAFVLNFFTNPTQVGIYSVALVLGESLWYLSNSVATVIFPRISRATSLEASAALASRSTRVSLSFTALVAIFVGSVSPWLIRTLFGSAFVVAAQALLILLPGIVMFSCANVLASYIAGRGHPQYNTVVACLALAVTVGCTLCLVPRWGLNGAALASSASYGTTALGSLYFYRRLSGATLQETIIPNADDCKYLRALLGDLPRQVGHRR